MLKSLIGLTAMAVLPALAQAQVNNECAGALTISAGVTAFDTSGATTSAPVWPCANGGSDIWYVYTAPVSGTVVIDTCNGSTGYDSALEAFSGSCAGLVPLICNDDTCGLQSQISFTASASSNYYIRVGGFSSGTGTGDLTLTEVPPGVPLSNQDDCGNAALDTIGAGAYDWDNGGATTGAEGQTEAGCYKFGTSSVQSDIWAVYVAGMNGSVTLETCNAIGSNGDTKLAAYPLAACASINGTSVACNDDTCGLQSQITFNVSCGESYLIQIGSFPGSGDGTSQLFVNETGSPCGPGPIGNPVACDPAIPNTTGQVAALSAVGQVNLGAMDVRLFCDNVPTGQFGIFFTSQTLGAIPMPGGSLGTICVLGNQGRYNHPSQIFTGAGAGSPVPAGGLQVGNIPVPINPPIAAFTPGTWYFQAWNREVGGNNNFSDVISIDFIP